MLSTRLSDVRAAITSRQIFQNRMSTHSSGCGNALTYVTIRRTLLRIPCHAPSGLTWFIVTIISRTCLITADLLLVCITWAKLYWKGGLWHSLGLNRFTTVLILDGTLVVHVVNALKLTKPLHRHNILRVSYRGLYSASPTLLTRPRQVCC